MVQCKESQQDYTTQSKNFSNKYHGFSLIPMIVVRVCKLSTQSSDFGEMWKRKVIVELEIGASVTIVEAW